MATDQEIQDRGIKFLPKQQYLQSPYQFNEPVVEEEEVTESFGIPNTNAFTNSGGGNSTGYNFGNTGFQQAVDARQERLNTPIDTSTFRGKAQSFLTPQSSQSIIEDGYQEPRFQPGIIGTMLGKIDNYRNLPRADQAFISSQMGYTGPTIFGENNSGLSKDEFGINTRSLFGNYAEYVDKQNLKENKAGVAVKDMTEEEFNDYLDTISGKIQKQKAISYRRKGVILDDDKKAVFDQQMADDKEYGKKGMSDPNDKSRAGSLGRRPGSGGTVDRVTEGPGQNVSNVDNQAYDDGGREGFGYGLKDGGRAGYFFGGRVNYKAGGRTDAGPKRTTASKAGVGQINESGQKVSGGNFNNNDGGNNNNPPVTVVEDQTSIFDTSGLKSKSPEIGFNYMDPKNYASLKSRIYNTNILDNDNINVEGNLLGEIGPVSYNTNFTDQGITGTNLKAGNFTTNLNPDMQVQNIGYNNNINGINYGVNTDFDNTMFTAGVKFKNGGLASIL